ncbi:rod shape determining protein RodA [Anaerobacterium chartisolvens]|uniref:Rod shape determining protein RodA n=1 Tax=Anaerobacterium chartisolvens TaxID=1297424 RepID=A0A369B7Q7_9FIRM|nr:FtsW/RodA/SpoVE family cell cycle protein [Anaerobacterium chartisolvens]RCX16567.1 rod shape determining protein RodA [Anaerobacterium chartisolvens]
MYSVEKTKGISFIKSFDYILFITVLTLSAIGLVVLYSATLSFENGDSMVLKQGLALAIGIVMALVISLVDYKDFKIIGIVFYVISVVLLVYVKFRGVGAETWGSNSWMQIPVFGSFQPSEIAKITFIVVISTFLERIKEGQGGKNIAKFLIYSAIPIGLVILQNDFGMSMVFIFVFFVMLFICGLPYKYMLGAFIAAIPCGVFTWIFLLNDKRRDRIRFFFNPEDDQSNAGFQVLRSIRAIGSGQIFGKKLFQGIQTQRGTVPVKESDFIFTVIGEELGFIGSAIVVIIIFFLLLRCVYIAKNSRDLYGSFLVTGLTAMMGFNFVENIGMNIGIFPITGLPLPFVSQGGSAMITNYIAIGIILSVSIRRKRSIFNSSQ